MLLQRLAVIGIFLILIYTLYKKIYHLVLTGTTLILARQYVSSGHALRKPLCYLKKKRHPCYPETEEKHVRNS
jgi:multisubunit Na+/H+ antiporter MnhC subunit